MVSRLLGWGLLAVILVIRFVDILEKRQLHPDEVYSVMIARCNPAFYQGVPPGTYTGVMLQGELTALHPLGDDLLQLYDENHDVPHASLYYMVLRVALQGQDVWSPRDVALRGGLLNLLFLAVAYLLLWRLMYALTRGDPWLTAASCAIAFLAPGAGECVVLVREYQMAMLGVVWYAYALRGVCRLPAHEKGGRRYLRLLSLALAAALCLSTGYLNVFWLVLLPLAWLGAMFVFGKSFDRSGVWRIVWQVALASVCALVLARGLYAGYFHFLTHGSVHKAKAFSDLGGSLCDAFIRDIACEGLTLPLLAVLAMCVAWRIVRLRIDARGDAGHVRTGQSDGFSLPFLVAMSAAAVATVVAVQYCSLLRQARYSYPYLPMLCGLWPLCAGCLSPRMAKAACACVMAWFVALGTVTSPRVDYGWERQAMLLRDGAVFHGLNPNELPLLYPVLDPAAEYVVEPKDSVLDFDAAAATVIHASPRGLPAGMRAEHAVGPLRIVYRDETLQSRP